MFVLTHVKERPSHTHTHRGDVCWKQPESIRRFGKAFRELLVTLSPTDSHMQLNVTQDDSETTS